MALPRLRANTTSEERMLHPNHMIYQKLENLVQTMLDPDSGVPIKTVKSFLTKVFFPPFSFFSFFLLLLSANV